MKGTDDDDGQERVFFLVNAYELMDNKEFLGGDVLLGP